MESYEEKEQKALRDIEEIEHAIAPLKFEEPNSDALNPLHANTHRYVYSPDGKERLGFVEVDHTSNYSWKRNLRPYAVTSERIPQGQKRYGAPTRKYGKLESVIEAIKKYCVVTSGDEIRAEELRAELEHYHEVLQKAFTRSKAPDGTYFYDSIIDLVSRLASDEEMDRQTGQEQLRVLIRKRRVNLRFEAWVRKHFVDPRSEELRNLDLSKEKVYAK